jgi:hypothetical protein
MLLRLVGVAYPFDTPNSDEFWTATSKELRSIYWPPTAKATILYLIAVLLERHAHQLAPGAHTCLGE